MPLILVIATGVQLWAGADIYRQAWAAAKHRATTMDTLVALGTGVAFGYSAFVTLWPAQAQKWGLPIHLYFETALIVVALVLMGRWLELKAKKRTAASIKSLVGLAPYHRPRPARRHRGRRPPRPGPGRRPRPGPARGEPPGRRHRRRRRLQRRRVDAHRRVRPGRQAARRPGHRGHREPHRHPGRSRRRRRRRQHPGPDHPPGRGRPRLPGPDAATGRPGLRLVRARGPARRARDLHRLDDLRPRHRPAGAGHRHHRRRPHHRLPLRPRAWRPRPPSWSAPARPPSSASSSATARRWRPHAGSPRSSWTRPAPSPTADPPSSTSRPLPGHDTDELLALVASAEVGSEHPVGEAIVTAARDRGLTLQPATDFAAHPGHGISATIASTEHRGRQPGTHGRPRRRHRPAGR